MIINLVAASGSGKTTIAKELEKYGYNVITSYTTRKPRHKDEWDHIFINGHFSDDHSYFDTKERRYFTNEMIALSDNYNNIYFALDEQILDNKVNIYAVNPNGAEQVKDYYKETKKVITIYLQADEDIRAKRLAKRIKDQSILKHCSNYKEIPEVWDRLRPDRDIFRNIKCDYALNVNVPLDKAVERVVEVIEEEYIKHTYETNK